jgi:hypothetical protein
MDERGTEKEEATVREGKEKNIIARSRQEQ